MINSRHLPPHAVDRPSLRQLLDSGADAPLSLIVAPAGAGKSVLLAQWVASRADLLAAWLDITPDDASPVVFSARLMDSIAALSPQYERPSAPLGTNEGRLGEPFLEDFARSLAGLDRVVLIFEDLDALTGSPILVDLWRLVDLLPANVHAVFASRADLHLGWSRHRLRHGLVELRQADLAFDDETTARVLERITRYAPSPEALAAVVSRTEGWAAGVQLTALGFRFSGDPDRVVDSLASSERLVVEYMNEEVLDALNPARRDALLKVAVADAFSADLVHALTGMEGAAFIADLERDSLFTITVPGQRGWYRFHPLFRDLLRMRLHASDPSGEAGLLETTALWFLETGDLEGGLDYLCRAHLWDAALEHLLGDAPAMPTVERAATIARWLGRIPPEARARHPHTDLIRGVAEMMSGHGAVAVEELYTLSTDERLSLGERQIALAYLAAGVQFIPHPESFLEAARRGLALLDLAPSAPRPSVLGVDGCLLHLLCELSLGRACFLLGEFPAARAAVSNAVRSAEMAPATYLVDALGFSALVDAFTGRLDEGTERADEALGIARGFELLGHHASADAFLARATIAIQRGEPEAGALALSEAAMRAAANGRVQLMWVAHLLAKLIDPDDTDAATASTPPGPPPPLVRRSLMALEMRQARFRGVPIPPPITVRTWSAMAFEDLAGLLETGRTAVARARMEDTRFADEPTSPLEEVERNLIVAWMWSLEGRRLNARDALGAALDAAEPEGLVHPFVRAGEAVIDLVDDMFGAHSEFARHVVRAGRPRTAPRGALLEELTPRELELLAFLPTRLTIADIADRCYVSTNTIKTHLKHIYRKLGVPGRNGAVDRAVQLNLLRVAAPEFVSV